MRTLTVVALLSLLAGGCARESAPSALAAPPAPIPLASPAPENSAEPFLSIGPSGVWMSWIEARDSTHAVRFARLDGKSWTEPGTIAESSQFFVNWADFPSILELSDGRLMAHWLQRSGPGRYSYDAMVAFSGNAGATWTEPVPAHSDRSATDHGFVSLFETDGSPAAVWLDGRGYDGEGGGEMSVWFTTFDATGRPAPDQPVDLRSCDCCQTDAAISGTGPVVVYRDRSPDEIRDIYITRRVGGAWTEPARVHADDWRIAACPVNGPAVAASGQDVVVAWFTNARDTARVNVAFSADAGATFADPTRIDLGDPVGRVDALLLGDGTALVSWLERGAGGTRVLARTVAADGRMSAETVIGESSDARASGFPRMIRQGDRVVVAWTQPGPPSVVRVAIMED